MCKVHKTFKIKSDVAATSVWHLRSGFQFYSVLQCFIPVYSSVLQTSEPCSANPPGNWIWHLDPGKLWWLHLVPAAVKKQRITYDKTSANNIDNWSILVWECLVSIRHSTTLSGNSALRNFEPITEFCLPNPGLFNSCCFSSSESGTCFGTWTSRGSKSTFRLCYCALASCTWISSVVDCGWLFIAGYMQRQVLK